ncbi:hypothetical protein [Dyella sp.]|uniref:hypothetical protein n=1 Tax=Dyella sp. TaxID=1869338 RepID=UPI002ED17F7A
MRVDVYTSILVEFAAVSTRRMIHGASSIAVNVASPHAGYAYGKAFDMGFFLAEDGLTVMPTTLVLVAR